MTENRTIIHRTASVCPVCLSRIPAELVRCEGTLGVWMRKVCREHGEFRTLIWKDRFDLSEWVRGEGWNPEEDACCGGRPYQPDDAGEKDEETCCCAGTGPCCVILEVTKACNLRCPYCFARGGEKGSTPSARSLFAAIDEISEKGGGPLLQLSGGEPTLRDDLPELVSYAKAAGCRYVQINTNGIRLAEDPDYVRRLAEAGLDIVFLQFDGADDEIYRKLRGRELLKTKEEAVRNCDRYRIGVTLVPTIVRGINDTEMGRIVRKALELYPAVRCVHFQPVTYLGRYPDAVPQGEERYTLDELMADLCDQTGIPPLTLLPSRCDHAMCEFHSTYLVNDNRQIVPLTDRRYDLKAERTSPERNREYVASHWRREPAAGEPDREGLPPLSGRLSSKRPLVAEWTGKMEMDDLLAGLKTRSFKLSGMAFQDAGNLDCERIRRCSLHLYRKGEMQPFCESYLSPLRVFDCAARNITSF